MEIRHGNYQHFTDGEIFCVLGTALCAETNRELVLYQHRKTNSRIMALDREKFEEILDFNGERTPRFTRMAP